MLYHYQENNKLHTTSRSETCISKAAGGVDKPARTTAPIAWASYT